MIPTSLAGIAFGIIWFAWMLGAPRFFARRQFRNMPSAQWPITLDISDSGLDIHTPHSESRATWSAYMAWGESKSVFVIMPQPRIYVPIPKRAFTPEQIGEFRDILRRNVSKK
jgi:hypothetical protein